MSRRLTLHRILVPIAGLLAGVAMFAGPAPAAPELVAQGRPQVLAQVPPSDGELRIYAGVFEAAAHGDTAEIEQLIAAGSNPNVQDSRSRTPLMVAAFFGHHDAARALIRAGANPNARDRQRYDILTIAAVNDDAEMIAILLAAGANPRAVAGPYDSTALIAAAHLGHAAIVDALIAARAPIDHINNLGWTALSQAIVLGNGSAGHVASVAALVRAGADVNITDRQGQRAIDHARSRAGGSGGYAEMVRILEGAEGRPDRLP
jgi:ankyrin repeat protein